MYRILVQGDRAAGAVARSATTLGQAALVVQGVHLAADNLDDRLLVALSAASGWLDRVAAPALSEVAAALSLPPDALTAWDGLPLGPAAGWGALVVEASAVVLLWGAFLLTSKQERPTWRRWRRAASVRAVVVPLTLAGVLLAGSWSLAMGVEDLLPAHALSRYAAALLGLAALLRFGLPAWLRAVAALDATRRWSEGLLAAVVLAPVGLLSWMHGVPVWGLLP